MKEPNAKRIQSALRRQCAPRPPAAWRVACLAFMLLAALPAVAQAPASAARPLLLGSAWYPEQWPESRWDKDLQLMQDAGLNVVRIGEFAWSSEEPSEGHYDLGWLERAIRLAAKHHIAVVLGTPTDAPPAWLTLKYSETLRVDADERPADVEVCRRVGGGRAVFVLINHGAAPATVTLPTTMKDVLDGSSSKSKLLLAPQGVAVLESKAQ